MSLRRSWFLELLKVSSSPPRSLLTRVPTWPYAGNLRVLALTIESIVEKVVTSGLGTKDDLEFVYISNPPRHGKSLLLDTLFNSRTDICEILPDELDSVEGALCGLCLRLLYDLVHGNEHRWNDIWNESPFAMHLPMLRKTRNASPLLRLFRDMLHLSFGIAPAKLLICIDEVSRLIDDPKNKWSIQDSEQSRFWRCVYSLTRADTNWVREVMTGFTDTSFDAMAAADVRCRRLSLSMIITNAEEEMLVAELMRAYACKNHPFPNLLWNIVKSTPGLLGLWAQHINLQSNLELVRPKFLSSLGSTFGSQL